ncbi:putative RNA methyltransferase [Marinobacterium rhizophilum]|uniref:Methyltransferase domain-containing protein n=1 Tax=Marinobacterium rhizophilum TaxID=420402 RepID=A0ABY5HKV2_9GAMM|nr:methyltransferase domain-containing protein [Marinobacterium rhizophilum]UTW11586.1 methyltransferase domain-containing protein [Marinobacterium rhizophilum]
MIQLACPLCREPLDEQPGQLRCGNGHSYDQARQGYWNLLLVQRKRSLDPGDNAAMVQARRAFLDQGHYALLSDRINALLSQALAGRNTPLELLDLGCGEGYYSARLEQALQCAGIDAALTGLDISKHAVRAACQRSRSARWLVASGADIPLPAASLDAITLLFSRLMPEPMAQVLKPGGLLLLAWPGDEHLIELRRHIYTDVRPSAYDPLTQLSDLFSLEGQQAVQYRFTLSDNDSIQTLLGMTPHSQRLAPAARDALAALTQLELTLDVNLAVLKRR